jgi:hypothetical protein
MKREELVADVGQLRRTPCTVEAVQFDDARYFERLGGSSASLAPKTPGEVAQNSAKTPLQI